MSEAWFRDWEVLERVEEEMGEGMLWVLKRLGGMGLRNRARGEVV